MLGLTNFLFVVIIVAITMTEQNNFYDTDFSEKVFAISEPSISYQILPRNSAKKGIIIPNGVILESHELMTAVFLTEQGHTIELIPKSEIEGVHTPDLIMDNELKWEMKTPSGKSKTTIDNQFKRASKQCPHLILDCRRMKRTNDQIFREAKRQFELSIIITRLILITKAGKALDFRK